MRRIIINWCLSLFILFATVAHADIKDGLIGHWTLNEEGGITAGDTSGNNKFGTIQNNPTTVSGKLNQALNFNGTNQYVRIAPNTLFDFGTSQDFSVSLWFKSSTNKSANSAWSPTLFAKGFAPNDNHFKLFIDEYSFNHLTVALSDKVKTGQTYAAQVSVNSGYTGVMDQKWHHVVVSAARDSALKLYLDGVLVGSAGLSSSINVTTSATPLTIGAAMHAGYPGSFGFFPGIMDDTLLYNRALSAGEVTQLYNAGNGIEFPPAADGTAPVISSIATKLTPFAATVSWATNEPGDTQIEYGPTTDYGLVTTTDTNLTATHSQVISGLTPETTYHFRIKSKDAANNQGQSDDQVFVTRAESGATVTAASCQQPDVQTAIDLVTYGGTVQIPANKSGETCQWTKSVRVDATSKSLIIKGAGWNSTIINAAVDNALSINGSEDYSFAVSDMRFTGGVGNTMIRIDGTSKSWRIHDIKFEPSGATDRVIYVQGNTYGVIDHNIVTGATPSQFVTVNDTDWTSWQRPLAFGDANAVYIEDNIISWTVNWEGRPVIDGLRGGRAVVRYNTVTNSMFGSHGFDSGWTASILQLEVYNNTVTITDSMVSWARFGLVRGGTGVWFNNHFDVGSKVWSYGRISLSVFRNKETNLSWPQCDGTAILMCSNIDKNWNFLGGDHVQTGTRDPNTGVGSGRTCSEGYAPKWKFCSVSNMNLCTVDSDCPATETCSGYVDGSGPDAYPCRMQPGLGSQNQSDPLYEWNNTMTGTSNIRTNNVNFSPENPQILINRDFFNDTCKPGYVPYTYPHPLTGLPPKTQSLNCPGAPEAILAGDVSGDGKVTMYDAALVLRFTLGSNLTDAQKTAADINADGKVDGADVVAIARKAIGL